MTSKHIDDSWKAINHDDVWVGKYYRWRIYTFAEAIQYHKETHDPSMYNLPKAPVIAYIELNTQGEKATRFVENFHRMAPIQHGFNHGEDRTVLVFTKGQENVEIAQKAGATLVGGPELIKDIQNGDLLLTDYEHVIAHTNILPDLVPVRGLMKRKFPNPKNGTLGTELHELIQKFKNGIQYAATKDENQKNFGTISSAFGTLDMDPKHLEENFAALLKDIDRIRPKRDGKFITRVLIKSAPSPEQFKIDPFVYVPEGKKEVKVDPKKGGKKQEAAADDDDEEPEAKEAVN